MKRTALTFEELDQRVMPAITKVGTHAVIDSFGGLNSAQVVQTSPGNVAVIQIQRAPDGHITAREQSVLAGIAEVDFSGGAGNDALFATNFTGKVVANGGAGNDYLLGGLGENVLIGGDGIDTVGNILASQGTSGLDGENVVNLGL